MIAKCYVDILINFIIYLSPINETPIRELDLSYKNLFLKKEAFIRKLYRNIFIIKIPFLLIDYCNEHKRLGKYKHISIVPILLFCEGD